jgi:hypothetical protein
MKSGFRALLSSFESGCRGWLNDRHKKGPPKRPSLSLLDNPEITQSSTDRILLGE